MPTIRILCVDDHPLILAGVAAIVSTEPDLEIVGQAANGVEALTLFRQLQPDITLMDLHLPDCRGVELISVICRESPQARVIALTVYKGDEDIYRCLEQGARAYLLKDTLRNDLAHAIRRVHRGERHLPPEVAQRLAQQTPRVEVTAREREVLQLIATGHRNKEIAAELGVSEETVKFHVKSILSKLDVSDRTHAVTTALQRGIIHLP